MCTPSPHPCAKEPTPRERGGFFGEAHGRLHDPRSVTAIRASCQPRAVRKARQPGWVRRLWGYMLRHRRDVVLSLGAAVLGSVCQTVVPLVERQIVDNVIVTHTSSLWPWLRAAGRPRRRPASGSPTSAATEAAGSRSSVQYDLRNDMHDHLQTHGLRQPRPHADRPAGRPGQLRLDARAGAAQLLPDHERQRAADAAVAGRDDLPLAAAGRWSAWSSPRPCSFVSYRMRWRVFPATWDGQQREGDVAQIVDEDVNGVRVVKAFGQERRELERVAGAAKDALRLADAGRAAAVALPAAARGDPDPRPGGDPRARRLAGAAPRDHPRDLPRLLDLHRPADGAGPAAGRRADDRPAGPGRGRAHLPAARPAAGHRRRAGCRRAARRCAARSPSPTSHFAYGDGAPVLEGFDLHVAPGERVAIVGPERQRQVDRGHARLALLRPRPRAPCWSTATTCATVTLQLAAPPGRRRLRGELPLLRLGARQHRLRPPRRHRRGDRGGRPGGPGPRVHRGAARAATTRWSASAG